MSYITRKDFLEFAELQQEINKTVKRRLDALEDKLSEHCE